MKPSGSVMKWEALENVTFVTFLVNLVIRYGTTHHSLTIEKKLTLKLLSGFDSCLSISIVTEAWTLAIPLEIFQCLGLCVVALLGSNEPKEVINHVSVFFHSL